MTSASPARATGLFIYYRVARDHVGLAVASVRGLQAGWQAGDATLRCETLRRVDDTGTDVTLMETYRREAGFDPDAQRRLEEEAAAVLRPWLIGRRHVEVFAPCA